MSSVPVRPSSVPVDFGIPLQADAPRPSSSLPYGVGRRTGLDSRLDWISQTPVPVRRNQDDLPGRTAPVWLAGFLGVRLVIDVVGFFGCRCEHMRVIGHEGAARRQHRRDRNVPIVSSLSSTGRRHHTRLAVASLNQQPCRSHASMTRDLLVLGDLTQGLEQMTGMVLRQLAKHVQVQNFDGSIRQPLGEYPFQGGLVAGPPLAACAWTSATSTCHAPLSHDGRLPRGGWMDSHPSTHTAATILLSCRPQERRFAPRPGVELLGRARDSALRSRLT